MNYRKEGYIVTDYESYPIYWPNYS